jgi:hypothetical protein
LGFYDLAARGLFSFFPAELLFNANAFGYFFA